MILMKRITQWDVQVPSDDLYPVETGCKLNVRTEDVQKTVLCMYVQFKSCVYGVDFEFFEGSCDRKLGIMIITLNAISFTGES